MKKAGLPFRFAPIRGFAPDTPSALLNRLFGKAKLRQAVGVTPVGNWPLQCGIVGGSEALSRPQVHTEGLVVHQAEYY